MAERGRQYTGDWKRRRFNIPAYDLSLLRHNDMDFDDIAVIMKERLDAGKVVCLQELGVTSVRDSTTHVGCALRVDIGGTGRRILINGRASDDMPMVVALPAPGPTFGTRSFWLLDNTTDRGPSVMFRWEVVGIPAMMIFRPKC